MDTEPLIPRRPGGAQIIPRPERWAHGPPAPWRDRHDPSAPLSTDEVLAALARSGSPWPYEPPATSRPSAVLVALIDGERGAEVLLTRRAWHLSTHKGEVSFPGGRMDPGETPIETALREAFEEVQLEPSLVDVRGELPHLHTIVSASYIVPVVGRLTERPELHASTGEVERIMFVPLVELTRPDTHREERWGTPPNDFPIQFFELDDETIWGATGRMLAELLRISYGVESPGPTTGAAIDGPSERWPAT